MAKIPTRGCTNLGIRHQHLLDIVKPSQLYKERHMGNLLNMRSNGDKNVQSILENRLEIESNYKNDTMFNENSKILNNIIKEKGIQESTGDNLTKAISIVAPHSHMNILEDIKKEAIGKIRMREIEKMSEKTHKLIVQGSFMRIVEQEG